LPAPAVGGWSTASGHRRAIYIRAIERGNLLVAEATLRAEIPRPTLSDLLELTALIAIKQPERFSRVAARWLLKYLETVDDATIYDAAFIASNLQALGGRQHASALTALRGMAEEATGRKPKPARGVA
jgi:hypothetical protein